MSTFSSLLKYSNGKAPGEVQRKARSDFPRQVAQSTLTLRNPSEALPSLGKHLIIGIATYSLDELNLLDQFNSCLRPHSLKRRTLLFLTFWIANK